MKRIITLLVAASMCFGSFAHASELSASGVLDFAFGANDNSGFAKGGEDHYFARVRMRPEFTFKAADNLKAVVQLQYGTSSFGDDNSRVNAGTNGDNFTIRRAYLDWNTNVADIRIGLQEVSLPSATFGNPIFDNRAAGITVAIPFNDMAGMNVFWLRPVDSQGSDAGGLTSGDYRHGSKYDIVGLSANFDVADIAIEPWFAYGFMGDNAAAGYENGGGGGGYVVRANEDGKIWAVGAAVGGNFTENLSFGFDLIYSSFDGDKKGTYDNDPLSATYNSAFESKGFLLAAKVDYAMPFGTVGGFAWYASGDDKSDRRKGEFGRIAPMHMGSDFVPTRLGFAGSISCGNDGVIGHSGAGTAGLGVKLADVSFVENLSHDFSVTYIMGTNDKLNDADRAAVLAATDGIFSSGENIYLTKEDFLIEFNVFSTYKIYENLTASIELGYIISDFDKKKGAYGNGIDKKDEDIMNAQVILRYSF